MAEEEGKQEEKFDFTAEGEALGYISLEQARVLAIEHARDNTDFYSPRYRQMALVWEVVSQEDGEDYYEIRLSFRPSGTFRGRPGVEQFIIDKIGTIRVRQLLEEPSRARAPTAVLAGIGVAVIAALILIGVVFALSGNRSSVTPTAIPTSIPIPPTATPVPVDAAKPSSPQSRFQR